MDNNRCNALRARGTATAASLLTDQNNYQPLEAETAPPRTEHAANRDDAVLAETQDDATRQKAGAKTQLKALGARLAARQAHAASATNPDPNLAGRVGFNRTSFNKAGDASIVTALLQEALPLAADLGKRALPPTNRNPVPALRGQAGPPVCARRDRLPQA
ncbi:hypothetical protein [Hymenobacter sp.]|uniref:hypothetical protein n=1 Tax=Hymenobacter sp. TaxID=1898978 RepID=UPI00286B0138|nr:hypothetical protein [Hymenobacter sp.]